MKPTPASSSCSADPAPADSPAWHVTVSAENEPLLLARVLQKFAVPEIELQAAHYEADGPGGTARVVLDIRASAARARLAASRLHRLLQVRHVELAAGPAGWAD